MNSSDVNECGNFVIATRYLFEEPERKENYVLEEYLSIK
jgi:hypothetical protein